MRVEGVMCAQHGASGRIGLCGIDGSREGRRHRLRESSAAAPRQALPRWQRRRGRRERARGAVGRVARRGVAAALATATPTTSRWRRRRRRGRRRRRRVGHMKRRQVGCDAAIMLIETREHEAHRAAWHVYRRRRRGQLFTEHGDAGGMHLLQQREGRLRRERGGVVEQPEDSRQLLDAGGGQLHARRRVALVQGVREQQQHRLAHAHAPAEHRLREHRRHNDRRAHDGEQLKQRARCERAHAHIIVGEPLRQVRHYLIER